MASKSIPVTANTLLKVGDQVQAESDGQAIKEGVQLRELIADAVDRQLKTIASNALLVA